KPKELEGSVVAQLKKQDDFWYADESPERQLPKTTSSPTTIRKPFFTQRWFATWVWILIIASFITVIIWFLAVSDVRVFRKAPARINPDSEETLPDDIFSIAFEKELKDSIATKNLRMATRLMYLHILKLLTEKNIIDYKAGRTNSDYLQQALDTSYYADLLRLTRSFEYVWYGKFDLQEPVFSLVQKNYETLKFSLT
ncbi:MAG TPA: DUF4129 domain-containing protein, partial [Chitinophagaceae bacterium]|nr:DUF4129 domain-containing protein [Chitinophagaceae bacterium]